MVFLITFIIFITGIGLMPFMGREYIPALEEGTIHLRATLDPNISLQESISLATSIEKILKDIPEVTGVLSRIGRGEVGSHAHFVNDAEILIQLKSIQEWKYFKAKSELLEEIEHHLEELPGVNLNITQPIAHNLDELITGVKAQLAIKIYGLYLSIPASIGFIAIFGIALEDGLVLLSSFRQHLLQGASMKDAIIKGVSLKIRPVLMTTFTTIFGIMPLLLAKGPGAEIQRPLATVVVGGLFTSTFVTLLVLPFLYQTLKKHPQANST